MAKVYISANNPAVAELLAEFLQGHGHTVVSSWHYDRTDHPACDEAWAEKIQARNVPEIKSADVLVLVGDNYPVPGGKHVEAGIALGLGKAVVVYGLKYDNKLYNHHRVTLASNPSGLRNAVHYFEVEG